MSNKRELKKAIRNICADLFAECASATYYSAKEQKENGEVLLTSIVEMNENFICRVSHPEPGMPSKAYFKDLIAEFNKQASAIIDARKMIVDGAVGMVEMALERLGEKEIVQLDEERKAAMVSNLLVVLCGNHDAQPVVNSGTLY